MINCDLLIMQRNFYWLYTKIKLDHVSSRGGKQGLRQNKGDNVQKSILYISGSPFQPKKHYSSTVYTIHKNIRLIFTSTVLTIKVDVCPFLVTHFFFPKFLVPHLNGQLYPFVVGPTKKFSTSIYFLYFPTFASKIFEPLHGHQPIPLSLCTFKAHFSPI